jgi:hypothetical protein
MEGLMKNAPDVRDCANPGRAARAICRPLCLES